MLLSSLIRPSLMHSAGRRVVGLDGTEVRFADGTVATCMTSGLWNVNFGYHNPEVTRAVRDALERDDYSTLFRYTHTAAETVAARLLRVLGRDPDSGVLFSTSGSAMNDAAVKLSRHRAALRGEADRRYTVSFEGSYHGMTLGAMALSGDDLGQRMFGVDRKSAKHLPIDDAEAWANYFDRYGRRTALVALEPVLGTGAHVPDPAVLEVIAEARDQYGFLVLADEVATGFHRTGPRLASRRWPLRPDLVGVSKALSNGTSAIAALMVAPHVVEDFVRCDEPVIHAETQAGSPLSLGAVTGVLDWLETRDTEAQVSELSAVLDERLAALGRRHGLGHRGVGLFRHVELPRDDAGGLDGVEAMVDFFRRQAGLVVHPGPTGVQLVPQLVMTPSALGEALDRFDEAVDLWCAREREQV